ncbi:MAG: glycoside hydrolase family 3 protein [Chlorobiaceae bacterium]|nr:glycoside hydrolase family 3 protein [Chlorobiaceae bacterium]NTV26790.1 glycoside hydrolase family 3 protein [Chlorobiaceae bacterium]
MTLLFGACTGTYQVREESRLNPNTAQAVFAQKDRWVDRTLSGMTLSEKVGQMIVASIEGQYRGNNDKEFLKISRLTEEGKIGGIMFLKGDVMGAGMLANHFQSVSKVPLLVSADMEKGVAMRLEGATEFAPAMAVAATGDSTLAQAMSAVIAREARAVGISQDYAPSADLNINPANPVINTRSFGDRIPLVIDMSSAVIDGLQSNGVAATVKHFPGHGDVTVDSHKALPILEGDRQRLDQYELKPFRAAIDRGVMSVMVGHLAVPKLTGSLEPASLSKTIVTDLLRKELGFTGVIVTDAMNMKALYNGSNLAEISVKAVQAGNDILLFPPDPELMHDAVVTAVEQGTISESRIDDSVRRILKLKRWLGLDRNKLSDLTRLQEKVRQPESLQLADKITRNSVTIIRDRNHLVPLRLPLNGQVLNIVLQDRQREENSRPFAEMLGRNHTVLQFRLTPSSNEQTIQEVANLAAGASAVIITTEVQATNNSILSKLSDRQIDFVHTLPSRLPLGTPVILISFGPPYLLDEFTEIGTAICAYSSSQQAEEAVVQVLNGEIPPAGILPVTLRASQP